MNLSVRHISIKQTVMLTTILLAVLAGLAYAMLQSRDVLGDNTISTASASLLLSTDGVHYSQAIPGFSFEGIVPGGYAAPVDGYSVYLKNIGTTSLDLNLVLDSTPTNPSSADLSKLNVGLTDVSGNTAPRGFILAMLTGNGKPIEGELAPGATRQYKLQALAADDAAPGATVCDIDLAFVAIARDPNAPIQ